MRNAATIAIALALALPTSPAAAEILAQCGPSKGHAWYFANKHLPEDQAGWTEDSTGQGQTMLIRDGDQHDIVFSDATGRTVSVRATGGKVYTLARAPIITLMVLYSDGATAVETYAFDVDEHGRGTLVWTSTKITGFVDRAGVYRSKCGE